MITIKTEKIALCIYGSIKELPIQRYRLMQQYMIQESGIGSTVADLDVHLAKVITLLQYSKPDEAKEELVNLRYNFFSLLSGLDFKSKAFACMVKDINGQEVKDLSSEGLGRIVKQFEEAGLTVSDLEGHWESVKKNLIQNLPPTSPDGSDLTLSTLKT